jgi:hypothetical protein
MDFGSKNLESIAELAQQMRVIASRAYFNPSGSAGARQALSAKVEEITELLKALPE